LGQAGKEGSQEKMNQCLITPYSTRRGTVFEAPRRVQDTATFGGTEEGKPFLEAQQNNMRRGKSKPKGGKKKRKKKRQGGLEGPVRLRKTNQFIGE